MLLALRRLQLDDEVAGPVADGPQLVHLLVEAFPDHAAVGQRGGRVLGDGLRNERRDVVERVEVGQQSRQGLALQPFSAAGERRQRPERLSERQHLPGSGPPRADLGAEPVQIPDLAQRPTQIVASVRILEKLRDSVVAAPDSVGVQEWIQEPGPEQARPHRGGRRIEHREQGGVSVVGAKRLDQLQVAARHGVQGHDRVRALDPGRAQMLGRAGADLLGVGDQCPGRAHQQLVPGLEAESVERLHPVPPLQLVTGRIDVEEPVGTDGMNGSGSGLGGLAGGLRQEKFAGLQALQFAGHLGRVGLEDHQLPRRDIQRGQPHCDATGDQGDDVVVPLRLQKRVRDHGPGGNRLDHLAPHDPLGLGGVLGLFADRDLPAELDQTFQVVVEGLGGDSGQRYAARGPVVARGQGEPEETGALLGVLAEQFVEVPHAKENEVVPVTGFHLAPLPHERGVGAADLSGRQGCGGLLAPSPQTRSGVGATSTIPPPEPAINRARTPAAGWRWPPR